MKEKSSACRGRRKLGLYGWIKRFVHPFVPLYLFSDKRDMIQSRCLIAHFTRNTEAISVHQRTQNTNITPIREVVIDLNMNSHMLQVNILLSPNHSVWLQEKIYWQPCKLLEGYCLTQLLAINTWTVFLVRHAGFYHHKN